MQALAWRPFCTRPRRATDRTVTDHAVIGRSDTGLAPPTAPRRHRPSPPPSDAAFARIPSPPIRPDTQVTTLWDHAGPRRDNEPVFSHAKDRPWTTRFLISKNVKRSTPVAGSHPSHPHSGTTYSDAHT